MSISRQIQRDVDKEIGKILKRLKNKGLDNALEYINVTRAKHSPAWNEELTQQLKAIQSTLQVVLEREG